MNPFVSQWTHRKLYTLMLIIYEQNDVDGAPRVLKDGKYTVHQEISLGWFCFCKWSVELRRLIVTVSMKASYAVPDYPLDDIYHATIALSVFRDDDVTLPDPSVISRYGIDSVVQILMSLCFANVS
ncbi:hypothetical protein AHF37_07392 [Paragonimus kellicotti]|nr:hypothetical protein AHF37_07392 [Paragonimus kellicotti]